MITRLDIVRSFSFRIGMTLVFLELIVLAVIRTEMEMYNDLKLVVLKLLVALAITAIATGCCILEKPKRDMLATWCKKLKRSLKNFPLTLAQLRAAATQAWAYETLEKLAEDLDEKSNVAAVRIDEYRHISEKYLRCAQANLEANRNGYNGYVDSLRRETDKALAAKLKAEREKKKARSDYQEAWIFFTETPDNPNNKVTRGIDLLPEVRRRYRNSQVFLNWVSKPYYEDVNA
jgi:hypothetical protein